MAEPRKWDPEEYEGSLAQRAVDKVFDEEVPTCEGCRKKMEWSGFTNSWLCFTCRKEVLP